MQSVLALSTIKAEYIAMTEVIKEGMWLKDIFHELSLHNDTATVYCDNQSTIHLAKSHVFHERSKLIDIHLHFVRYVISSGDQIKLKKVSIEENLAYMFTKALTTTKFRHSLNLVNMRTC